MLKRAPRQHRTLLLTAVLSFILAACGSSLDAARGSAEPTPTDFRGLVKRFAAYEISVSNVVSGDPGCSDQDLVPMAIAFQLSGGGIITPVQARIYRFKNQASYDKLRARVDSCAAEWITNPAELLMVDASPYVLVTEGVPEGAPADAIRAALAQAAAE